MATELKPWDAAEFLNTAEAVEEYLIASFEDAHEYDDPRIITKALGTVARAEGMTEIARRSGLSRASLYKSLGEAGNPELPTLIKVMTALGLRLTLARASEGAEAGTQTSVDSAA